MRKWLSNYRVTLRQERAHKSLSARQNPRYGPVFRSGILASAASEGALRCHLGSHCPRSEYKGEECSSTQTSAIYCEFSAPTAVDIGLPTAMRLSSTQSRGTLKISMCGSAPMWRINFISKQDLITSKRAAGRPQDLIDADSLSKVDAEEEDLS